MRFLLDLVDPTLAAGIRARLRVPITERDPDSIGEQIRNRTLLDAAPVSVLHWMLEQDRPETRHRTPSQGRAGHHRFAA